MVSAFPEHPLAPSATLQAARALADTKKAGEPLALLADFPTKYPASPLVADARFLERLDQEHRQRPARRHRRPARLPRRVPEPRAGGPARGGSSRKPSRATATRRLLEATRR